MSLKRFSASQGDVGSDEEVQVRALRLPQNLPVQPEDVHFLVDYLADLRTLRGEVIDREFVWISFSASLRGRIQADR